MKKWIYISIIILLASCEVSEEVNSGQAIGDGVWLSNTMNPQSIHCVHDFLVNEDLGGEWRVLNQPAGSTLPNPLTDLCPDFIVCGDYQLEYYVENTCCKDSTIVNITKSLLLGSGTCQ